MSRSLLHDWESSIENLSGEMSKIAEDIYNTAYARGKNHSDVADILDKIRAEIDLETRIQVKHYTNTDDVIDAVLDVIDGYKEGSEET